MAQKAIIHTATRVIRRLTTDDAPTIASDETIIDLAENIDLAGGYWKLNNQNKKVSATAQDISDAGVDENIETQKRLQKIQVYKNAIDAIIADNTIPLKIRNFLQALKDLS
jgi:hypothetical protein